MEVGRETVEPFKRHIVWLERGRKAADAITGTVVQLDSDHSTGAMGVADRARRFYFWSQPPGSWINWELTWQCPQACRHCFQPLRRSEERLSWSRSQWETVVQALSRWEPSELSLTGGDPALVQELPQILLYLRQAMPQTHLRLLTTGPGLRSREDLQEILAGCAQAQITLHLTCLAPTPQRHDELTHRPGSFTDLQDLAESASAAGVPLELRLHLFHGPLSSWQEAAEWAETLAPGRWYASSLLYPPRYHGAAGTWQRLLPSIATLRQALADDLFAPLAAEYVTFEPVCGSGCQVLSVDPAGRIHGCDVAVPDANAPPIEQVEDSMDVAQAWRQAQRRPERCGNCEWRSWCRYCPAVSEVLGEHYCRLVDLAARHVRRRLRAYLESGAEPVYPGALEPLGQPA